jgi:hypothetical protein
MNEYRITCGALALQVVLFCSAESGTSEIHYLIFGGCQIDKYTSETKEAL